MNFFSFSKSFILSSFIDLYLFLIASTVPFSAPLYIASSCARWLSVIANWVSKSVDWTCAISSCTSFLTCFICFIPSSVMLPSSSRLFLIISAIFLSPLSTICCASSYASDQRFKYFSCASPVIPASSKPLLNCCLCSSLLLVSGTNWTICSNSFCLVSSDFEVSFNKAFDIFLHTS